MTYRRKACLCCKFTPKSLFNCGYNLATKNLKVLTLSALTFLQSYNQSWQKTPTAAQQQFSNSSVPPEYTSIHVPSSTTQSVTFCKLPVFLSQSTIGGGQGSNACTAISLLAAKTYLTNKSLLQLNNHQSLTPSWILAFISCMMGGKSDMTVSCCHNHILALSKP